MSPTFATDDILVPDPFTVRAILTLAQGYEFHLDKPMPNGWWRFWQWALLGWKWRKPDA